MDIRISFKIRRCPLASNKKELLDYAYRTGAPPELIQNLLEIEDEEKEFEGIDDLWPDYPDFKEFLMKRNNIIIKNCNYFSINLYIPFLKSNYL